MRLINIDDSQVERLPYLSNDEIKNLQDGKGWGFSNATSLSLLRDVYLLIRDNEFSSINSLLKEVNSSLSLKKEISERGILEPINVLRNSGYIQKGKLAPQKIVFSNSTINTILSDDDKDELKNIFFQILRFKEVMLWFVSLSEVNLSNINEEIVRKNSKIIYSFSWQSRFTDSIIYELKEKTTVFSLEAINDPKLSSAMFRFWDAFTSWGRSLGLLEKVNMKYFDYHVTCKSFSKEKVRVINCVYFKNQDSINFDLIDYIKEKFKSKVIYIPDLVFDLVITYRFGINEINEFIIDEYLKNKSICFLERTSEIFITRKKILEMESIPFPIYQDSYISHFILR